MNRILPRHPEKYDDESMLQFFTVVLDMQSNGCI